MGGALRGSETRTVEQQQPEAALVRAQQPSEGIPLSGIVGPSLVGAMAVGAAVASVSNGNRKRVVLKAEAGAATPAAPPVFDPSKEMGIGPPPIGFFDPLGFSKGKDEKGFRELRCAELKHGRVAMMASVGAVFQHFVKFPGFENVKGTFGAVLQPAGTLGFVGVFVLSSVLELAWREDPNSKWAGDYGDPLNVNMMSDEMRNKEVNNGRMAMISCLAIWLAEVVSGKDAMEQFGL